MEQKINNLIDTIVQNTDLIMIIDVINNEIETINKFIEKGERDQQVSVLTCRRYRIWNANDKIGTI